MYLLYTYILYILYINRIVIVPIFNNNISAIMILNQVYPRE